MWGLQRDDQRGPACRDREAVSNVGDELGLNLGYDSFSPLSRLSPWGGISLGETKQGMGGQVAGNMSMTFLKYAQAAAIAKQGGLSGVSTHSSQAGPGIGMLSQHLGLPQSVAFEASHRGQLMSGHSGNHRPETSPQLNPLVNNAQVIFQPKPLIARIGSQVRQQALGLPGRHAPDLMHHHDTSVYGSMTSMGLGMDRSGDGLCIPDKNVLVQGAPSMLMPGASRKDFDDIWGTSGVVHAPLIVPLVAQSRMISARQQNVAPPPPEKLLRAEEIHEIVELLHEYRDQSEHAIYTRCVEEDVLLDTNADSVLAQFLANSSVQIVLDARDLCLRGMLTDMCLQQPHTGYA